MDINTPLKDSLNKKSSKKLATMQGSSSKKRNEDLKQVGF